MCVCSTLMCVFHVCKCGPSSEWICISRVFTPQLWMHTTDVTSAHTHTLLAPNTHSWILNTHTHWIPISLCEFRLSKGICLWAKQWDWIVFPRVWLDQIISFDVTFSSNLKDFLSTFIYTSCFPSGITNLNSLWGHLGLNQSENSQLHIPCDIIPNTHQNISLQP